MRTNRLLLFILVIVAAGCTPVSEETASDDSIAPAAANEALIAEVLELIENRQMEAAMALYAEDYIYHGPGGLELRGRDGIHGLWNDFLTGFPDLTSTVHETIVKDDRIVLRWTIYGTHTGEFLGVAPTGNSISLPITEIFRVSDGQLAEAWDQWDRMGLMQQIGALVPE